MTTEQIRLEIQLEVKKALGNLSSMSGEFKKMAEEAKRAAPATNDVKTAIARLEKDLSTSAKTAALFGDEIGGLKDRQAQLRSTIVQLIDQGLEPQTEVIQNLKSEYDAAGREVSRLSSEADKLTGSLGQVVEAIGAAAAAKGLTQFAGQAAAAFNGAEASALRLRMTMEMRGIEGGYERISAFAGEIQNLTGASDDLVKQLAAELAAEGKSEAQIRRLFTAAADLSAVTGDNLRVSVQELSNTMSGMVGRIGRAIPELKNLTEEQLRSGAAITMVAEKYAGYAERMQGSGAVATDRMRESVGDLVEAIGEGLAPTINLAADLITAIAQSAANAGPVIKGTMGAAVAGLAVGFTVLAAKAAIATAANWTKFASLQAVNAAMAVLNPLLIAGIAAAVAAAGAATIYAASKRKEADAIKASAEAKLQSNEAFSRSSGVMDNARLAADLYRDSLKSLGDAELSAARASLQAQLARAGGRLGTSAVAADLAAIDAELAARGAVADAAAKVARDKVAAAFKVAWEETFGRYQAQSSGDPYAVIEYERKKKLAEAAASYIGKLNQQTIDEINKYYNEQRIKVQEGIAASEKELLTRLSGSRAESLALEKEKTLASFQGSEETRAAIASTYDRQIADTRIEEARRASVAAFDLANQERAFHAGLTASRLDDLQLEADRALALFEGSEENRLALAAYYARQIADLEIDEAKRAADERIAQTRRAFEEARRLAAEQGRWGEYATKSAADAAKDTEVGKMLGLGGQPAQDWKQVLIDSALNIAIQNEEVQKVMNIFSTILKGLVQAVLPPLAKALTWLYDKVIVPVGNGIIWAINGVIKLINKIPGVNIKLVETLKTSEQILQAEKEIASKTLAVSDEMDRIRQVFADRRKEIEDAYRKNVASLQKLLELGVMSEADYDKRIQAVNIAKDVSLEMLRSAEQQQLDTLEGILEQLKKGLNVSVNVLRDAGVPGFAVGSVDIPQDTRAVVHKGEMVVSTPFAEGVRRGEITIGGAGNGGGHVENYYITLAVKGSVVTKNELVDDIAVALKQKRTKGTLPAGAIG
jgi:hypothetical protein